MQKPPRVAQNLAQRLLALTVLMGDAIRRDDDATLTATLEERQAVLDALAMAPLTPEAGTILRQVTQEEQRVMRLMEGSRRAARQGLNKHHQSQAGLRQYRAGRQSGRLEQTG